MNIQTAEQSVLSYTLRPRLSEPPQVCHLVKANVSNMRSRVVSLFAAGLLLSILAASQLSVHAQGRERPNLSQEKAPQPTLAQAAKIETSGGQKTETRATKKIKWRTAGTTASTQSQASTLGNLRTPENNDAGGTTTGGPSGAKTAATYNVGVVAGANGCPPGCSPYCTTSGRLSPQASRSRWTFCGASVRCRAANSGGMISA